MNALLVIRRTHLYLGLFLLPWVVMFGVSSLPINHTGAEPPPVWTVRADVPFAAVVPAPGENLRPLGREMMAAAGISGQFLMNRSNPRQIILNRPSFLHQTRLVYSVDEQRLVDEERTLELRSLLVSLHTRAGFYVGGVWNNAWAAMVDVVSLAMLVWIATGLVLWWKLPGTGLRRWGWLALAGGLVSFTAIVLTL